MLGDEVAVAVVAPTPQDLERLTELAAGTEGVTGVRLLPVPRGRAELEAVMDAVEQALVRAGELGVFLQMAPDGFRAGVDLVVEAEVPGLRAWAADALPPDLLRITVTPP